MRRWCNELLVGNSWNDTKNFSKEFHTNFKLLIIKLKLVRRRILDLGNSKLELLHVDLRNISTDKEYIVAWRKLENIQKNLICGFLLLLEATEKGYLERSCGDGIGDVESPISAALIFLNAAKFICWLMLLMLIVAANLSLVLPMEVTTASLIFEGGS
ncbi:hypothetical protein Tco_1147805 [Tanacetum coccineum]